MMNYLVYLFILVYVPCEPCFDLSRILGLFYMLCCRIILYAIAMADYDQDNPKGCKDLLKTKDGIDRLALYHKSVGR